MVADGFQLLVTLAMPHGILSRNASLWPWVNAFWRDFIKLQSDTMLAQHH